jgi:amidohydrolase
MSWQQALDRALDDGFADMAALRRHLHMHPEPSGEEFKTSLAVYQRLGDLGFHVRMAAEGRGVIADISPTPSALPLLGLRADMDALRIQDAKFVDYRSQCPGIMHACGHDAHTAIVYGVLAALKQMETRGEWPWPVRVRGIFQPAEETGKGATEMIASGALYGVGSILANHMDPTRKVGRIALKAGVLTASCDDMKITIVGRGGHAARPHEAHDPIAAAAQLISALYLFVPRSTDSQDAVVVTIGQVIAGDNPNVIPQHAMLHGTLRTLSADVRRKTIEQIHQIAHGVGQTTTTQIEVRFDNGAPSVENSPEIIDLLRIAGTDALGREGIEFIPRPSMGGEDFSFYLAQVSGAMLRIGSTSDKAGGHPLHSPSFDIDEEALRVAARVMGRAAIMWSQPK